MIEIVMLGLAWLSISSVSVISGRVFQPAWIAYPVAAVASFSVMVTCFFILMSVPALTLLLQNPEFPFALGQN